jgi:chorismate mutase
MSTNEIKELEARIDAIDREIGALQNERLFKGLRFALLLKQNALTDPPVESEKHLVTWADAKYAPGVTGFEETL